MKLVDIEIRILAPGILSRFIIIGISAASPLMCMFNPTQRNVMICMSEQYLCIVIVAQEESGD